MYVKPDYSIDGRKCRQSNGVVYRSVVGMRLAERFEVVAESGCEGSASGGAGPRVRFT